jgi:hypothetical protein
MPARDRLHALRLPSPRLSRVAALACGASLSTTGCFILSLDGFDVPADAATHPTRDAAPEGAPGTRTDAMKDVDSSRLNVDAFTVLLTTGLMNPTQLLVDDGGLYTVDPGAQMVFRIDKQNGAVTPLVSSTLEDPTAITLDPTYVYVADNGDRNANGRGIYRVDKSGGSATLLAEPPAYSGLNAMTVDPTWVYWTEDSSHDIGRASINGGSYISNYAMDSSPDYSTMGLGALGIAVDATSLYWADNHAASLGGAIQSQSLANVHVATLATSLSYPTFLAIDETSVYWAEAGDDMIKSEGKAGGPVTTLATGQNIGTGLITIDSTYVYWANEVTGEVVRVAKTGGASAITLATYQNQPTGIAVDDVAVYWTNTHDGTVGRVLK